MLAAMGLLMAMVYDRVLGVAERACLGEWRRELLADLHGEVLEIGAGTGANLELYPPAVTRLVLTEPDRHMRERLEAKVRADSRADIVDAKAEALPFEDASFDAIVCTLVLCSVPDVDATLREARRVLRPGARFVYLEHVAAEEPSPRLRWQRVVEPVWKHVAEGCHLTRRTGEAIRRAGFEVVREERASMRKAPSFVRPTVRGVARAPSARPISAGTS